MISGNKLAITNGKFPSLPPNPRLNCFYDIIKGCLNVPTSEMLTTSMILERLAAIAEANNFDPQEPARVEITEKPPPPARPAPPTPSHSSAPSKSAPPKSAPSVPQHRPAITQVQPQKVSGHQSSGLC